MEHVISIMEYVISIIVIVIIFIIITVSIHRAGKSSGPGYKKAWQQFAESNNLHFESGRSFGGFFISGDFRGYILSLKNYFYPLDRRHTTFELKRNETLNHSEKRQTDSDTMRRFWAIYNRIKSGNRKNVKCEMKFIRSESKVNKDVLQPTRDKQSE